MSKYVVVGVPEIYACLAGPVEVLGVNIIDFGAAP
jgi:hypothetical protein